MPIETESEPIQIGRWNLRIRRPQEFPAKGLILLLHGWAGDERVMWIFARHFPKDQWIVAPRALYTLPESGYGWTQNHAGLEARIDDYTPAVQELDSLIDQLFLRIGIKPLPITLVGFSQGTALAYTFSLSDLPNPRRVRGIAGLAGFLPHGAEETIRGKPLSGIPVWIAHGLLDETVPIDRAREAARILEQAGAIVDICESEVGHKLGVNCFRLLDEFINRVSLNPAGFREDLSPAEQ